MGHMEVVLFLEIAWILGLIVSEPFNPINPIC